MAALVQRPRGSVGFHAGPVVLLALANRVLSQTPQGRRNAGGTMAAAGRRGAWQTAGDRGHGGGDRLAPGAEPKLRGPRAARGFGEIKRPTDQTGQDASEVHRAGIAGGPWRPDADAVPAGAVQGG